MEMTYPVLFYIGIAVAVIVFIFTLRNSRKYKGGKKAANSNFVKDIKYYRKLMFRYECLKILMTLSIVVAILMASFLMSKPVEVRSTTTEEHHRDIFISFDVSTSLDGINLQMCKELKEFVGELKGERFGFAIFNCRSVTIVPLTTDYDYVIDQLDMLQQSITMGQGKETYDDIDDTGIYGWRFSGLLSNIGSSFIGDGLASALYSFPDLDEAPDRSRLIVFVTDNDLNDPDGYQVVSVDRVCDFCAKRKVKVFALAPDFVKDEDNYVQSILKTKGGYYNTRNATAMEQLLEDVLKTDVTATYDMKTRVVDVPEAAAITLLASIALYSFCVWRMKL